LRDRSQSPFTGDLGLCALKGRKCDVRNHGCSWSNKLNAHETVTERKSRRGATLRCDMQKDDGVAGWTGGFV